MLKIQLPSPAASVAETHSHLSNGIPLLAMEDGGFEHTEGVDLLDSSAAPRAQAQVDLGQAGEGDPSVTSSLGQLQGQCHLPAAPPPQNALWKSLLKIQKF